MARFQTGTSGPATTVTSPLCWPPNVSIQARSRADPWRRASLSEIPTLLARNAGCRFSTSSWSAPQGITTP